MIGSTGRELHKILNSLWNCMKGEQTEGVFIHRSGRRERMAATKEASGPLERSEGGGLTKNLVKGQELALH